jgi:hypothetical protein
MRQLHWPENADMSRYSIPQHDHHYRHLSILPKVVVRQAYRTSADTSSNRISRIFSHTIGNKRSLSNNIEHLFEGLDALDRTSLDQMKETDLLSSSNG